MRILDLSDRKITEMYSCHNSLKNCGHFVRRLLIFCSAFLQLGWLAMASRADFSTNKNGQNEGKHFCTITQSVSSCVQNFRLKVFTMHSLIQPREKLDQVSRSLLSNLEHGQVDIYASLFMYACVSFLHIKIWQTILIDQYDITQYDF